MIWKNKCGGMFYHIFIVMGMLLVVIFAFSTFMGKQAALSKTIGERQFELIDLYQKGELVQSYLEQATVYSAEQAIHELGESGGFFPASSCGTSPSGFSLWESGGASCYPSKEDLEESFGIAFNAQMKPYISRYGVYRSVLPATFLVSLDKDLVVSVAAEQAAIIHSKEGFFDEASFILGPGYGGTGSDPPENMFPPGGYSKEGWQVVKKAMEYLGTKYSRSSKAGPVKPKDAAVKGTTCATFVQSAFKYSGHSIPRGNGNSICFHSTMVRIGKDPDKLRPGDVFSSTSSGPLGRFYGHTGIYVGKGRIEGGKFGSFVPDPNGEHIFIHSGRVRLETYDEIFGSFRKVITFCRHRDLV